MAADGVQQSSVHNRAALRAFFECLGWFAVLGAVYLPVASLAFIGLSSRVSSGDWDTVDDPEAFFPLLTIGGFIGGGILGLVSGIVVATSLGWISAGSSEPRLRVVGAASAGGAVLLITGVVTVYMLGSPQDALMWDLMTRPVWVLASCLVPTAIASSLVYWRAPRWVATTG